LELASGCDDFYRGWKLLWPQWVLDTTNNKGTVWEVTLAHALVSALAASAARVVPSSR
jgi:hypothetical protein